SILQVVGIIFEQLLVYAYCVTRTIRKLMNPRTTNWKDAGLAGVIGYAILALTVPEIGESEQRLHLVHPTYILLFDKFKLRLKDCNCFILTTKCDKRTGFIGAQTDNVLVSMSNLYQRITMPEVGIGCVEVIRLMISFLFSAQNCQHLTMRRLTGFAATGYDTSKNKYGQIHALHSYKAAFALALTSPLRRMVTRCVFAPDTTARLDDER